MKVFLKNSKWEVLILKTPDGSSFHWKYDFPWGRIDEDEFYTHLLEILDREIKEEVWDINYKISNNIVAVARHRAEYDTHREDLFYPFYEAKLLDWEVDISDEHNDFKWVNLEEIVLEDYFESGMLEWVRMYLGR